MAAGSTYTPIATTTLGSAAATVTFSSIASTYTDLIVIINAIGTTANTYKRLTVNSDSGSNYSRTVLSGDGTSALSFRSRNATSFNFNGYSALITPAADNSILHFQNYSNTTTYKTILTRSNNANYAAETVVGLWRSTAAINRIDFTLDSSTYAAGSTFTLYGIAAA